MPEPSSTSPALSASCHCGAVRIEIDEPPALLTQCNCSICRRYGALWAYYTRRIVRVVAGSDQLETYTWQDHEVQFQRCRSCGCVTHWDSADLSDAGRIGVNARNIDQQAAIAHTPIKLLDGDGDWETLSTWVQPELFISPTRLKEEH